MRPVAPPFRGVVVAEVLSVAPHPDADRLRVCKVDAGQGESLSIVCGAPNVRAGMKVPCALVGAELPPAKEGTSEPFRIKLGKIRGVESRGMLCSARELKLSDDHEGLLVLDDQAVIGRDLRTELALDDTIFTLKLTPNLGHALSVFGVARELAAITGAPLKTPEFSAQPVARRPRSAGDGRGARSVRALLRPRRPERRSAGEDAALDGRTSRPLRPAHGRAAGRHLELRDVRARPAVAHLRSRQDRRRPDGALGQAGRVARAAQRQHGRARRDGRRHRRSGSRRVARRHHGRRRDRGLRCDAQRLRRGCVLVAGSRRRTLASLPLLDRCRPPLRARRRSGDDGRAHRAADGADRRHLRRQRDALRPDRRSRRRLAGAEARAAARRSGGKGHRHAGDAGGLRSGDGASRLRLDEPARDDRGRAAELALRPAHRGRPDRRGHPPDRLRHPAGTSGARRAGGEGRERSAPRRERAAPVDGRPRLAGNDQLQLRRRALGARFRRQPATRCASSIRSPRPSR